MDHFNELEKRDVLLLISVLSLPILAPFLDPTQAIQYGILLAALFVSFLARLAVVYRIARQARAGARARRAGRQAR